MVEANFNSNRWQIYGNTRLRVRKIVFVSRNIKTSLDVTLFAIRMFSQAGQVEASDTNMKRGDVIAGSYPKFFKYKHYNLNRQTSEIRPPSDFRSTCESNR